MMGSLVSPEMRARVRGVAVPIALAFGRLGFTPNALTVVGFGISLIAAIASAQQAWIAAGLLVIFGGVFDLFDGALARATNQVSRLGAFLDSVFDRAGEAVLYLGIVIACENAGFRQGTFLAAAAMAAGFMVSYTRAKSESLGFTPGSGMANIGVAPREVRLVLLTIGLLLTGGLGGIVVPYTVYGSINTLTWAGRPALAVALGLIAVLGTVTTIQRIVHVTRQTTPDPAPASIAEGDQHP
ncbi:MAG: CDP-diacylglycerol---glycerol-3-phosphate 3-phosphatidyltransferase [Chloroflexota bacterium]|jgi:CDP-diacylglycerol--glycerol-3-phosphate 3-phosphatidyltransferase|nr:CDP-diacylglycerol---glycerol-3-phosphate 3-phosphatidyltransferase [Chloroflexota bacterium]